MDKKVRQKWRQQAARKEIKEDARETKRETEGRQGYSETVMQEGRQKIGKSETQGRQKQKTCV
jgi:hypothetical protein